MKTAIPISIFIMMLVGMACVSPSSIAATSGCEEVYYSPDDLYYQHPLQLPDPKFMKSYKLAKAGNAIEQRNVAVSYNVGYLVPACPEKAHYWYQKAANNGDLIAQNWIASYNKFKEMSDGPEFAIVNHIDPPKTLASVPDATKKANAGGSQQQPAPKSAAEEMLAEYSHQSNSAPDAGKINSTSDFGKIVHVGQSLGDLLMKPENK
jgi:hypothetical protein